MHARPCRSQWLKATKEPEQAETWIYSRIGALAPNRKTKTLQTYSEKAGGRDAVLKQLGEAVRTHYDQSDRIADDVARLGYDGAAEILRALLPQSKRARSGDLGEILASELVEEETGFRVPVRRMRFKDGREVAMRGDDFIGVGYDSDDKLWLLKGESSAPILAT